MGSLERRIASLEAANSGGGWGTPPCDECGWRGPDDDSEAERHIFTWEGGDYSELVPRDEHGEAKEYCSSCGRKLVWFPSFDNEAGYFYYFMVPRRQAREPSL